VHSGSDVVFRDVDGQISLGRILIRIIDTSEALDLARTRLCINTALVRLLSVLEGCGHMHKVKASVLLDELACLVTGVLKWRNGGGNNSSTGPGELRGDERDTCNVLFAVGAREAKLRGELVTHGFAEEEGDGASSLLVEGYIKGTSDGVFARVLVTSEENGETLFAAGRVGFAEDLDDFRV
jgi:hypothetical protein